MFRYLKTSVLALAIALTASTVINRAEAADLARLNNLFQQHFWGSFYREGKCGPNSEHFVRLALSQGIDLNGAAIVHVENKGGDTFGLVAAVKAREQGRYFGAETQPSKTGPVRDIGSANWYYHAFVVADGYVFDFDFQNTPTVLGFVDYIYAMFIPDAKMTDPKFIKNKFSGYYLNIFSVKSVDSRESFRVPISDILHKPTESYLIPFIESLSTQR